MAQEVTHSSLKLAFLGDAVYELVIRKQALDAVAGHVDKLNRFTKQHPMAAAQAKIADYLVSSEVLTEEEQTVLKRGRNAKSASLPRSCTPAEYRKATGLEALMGYLYLEDRMDRVEELIRTGAKVLEESGE